MQLVGMSTGNSCHGNVKLQGSLSCSASSWVVTEWRGREGKEGESTQAHKVEKVLRVMWMESPGKFLIGGEVLGGLSINFFIYLIFLCESCSDGNAFLCVVFFHRKYEDIYSSLFIWDDLTVYLAAHARARFFQLHYPYTSENGPVVLQRLCGCSMAILCCKHPE